jgi:catechol 2,3-dioxygenase-like lactoylglutathione lyase family enzyme
MPSPDKFSHVVLRTHDVERMKNWYTTAFGLTIEAELPGVFVVASYDEESHRIALTAGAPAPGPDGRQVTTLKHMAFGYDSLGKMLDQYKHMKAAGYTPDRMINHGPTLSMYFDDPDGNGIEFFTECFPTLQECKDFMKSEAFFNNMIGYPIDPEQVLKQHEAGVDPDEIMRYDLEASRDFAATHDIHQLLTR